MHRVDGGTREELERLLERIVDLFPGGKSGVAWFACTPGRHGSIGDQSVAFLHALSSSRHDMHSLSFLPAGLYPVTTCTQSNIHTHGLLSLLLGMPSEETSDTSCLLLFARYKDIYILAT